MDPKLLLEYIDPRLFILMPFLYVIGMFLKLTPKFKQEWAIPFILWAVALIYTPLWLMFVLSEGFSIALVVMSILQATLIAAVPVFFNQLLKQGFNKRN